MTSPDGANPSGSIGSLAGFASQTEAQAQAPWEDAIASLFTFDNLFGGIASAIGGLLGGSFSPDGPGAVQAIEHLSATTQALIDDIELLNGVPAYGAAYQSWNIIADATTNYKTLPFNAAIGPRKRVDIIFPNSKTDGGLVGYDPGLWEVSVITQQAAMPPFTGSGLIEVKLQIDVFDSPSHILFSYNLQTNADDSLDSTTAFTYPFVVPSNVHHFDVRVKAYAGAVRAFRGGTRYSGLWLRRISEDVANTSTSATVLDA